jgi:hypothetical protein
LRLASCCTMTTGLSGFDFAAGSIPTLAADRDCSGRGKGCPCDPAAPALSQGPQGSSGIPSVGEPNSMRVNLPKLVCRLN